MSVDFLGMTNTATSPATGTRALAASPINYAADWRIVSESPGEVVLTNLLADIGTPEKVRIAVSDIADIFKGSGITPPTINQVSGAQGVSILLQETVTIQGGDGTLYPATAHIVLKLPKTALMVGADVESLVERLLGHMYETGSASLTTRIEALMRGSIVPIDV